MQRTKARRRTSAKQTKVQIRLRAEQKAIISNAARLRQTTLSNFMLENAYSAAQQVLGDQIHFALPHDRWQKFCRALDAPPRTIPSLKKLLTQASILDGEGRDAS